jgi:hypothetical protein
MKKQIILMIGIISTFLLLSCNNSTNQDNQASQEPEVEEKRIENVNTNDIKSCTTCNGAGELSSCSICNNYGNTHCPRCRGYGNIDGKTCLNCTGNGILICYQCEGNPKHSKCHVCDGTGQTKSIFVECTLCNGKKTTECFINSSGVCEQCNNTGFKACGYCDGVGGFYQTVSSKE